ncbi:hypothetical protein [Paracoccus aminovorans]|uniref:hypothetical protein n=1 Tax=Paracoccus aminovorans TaxID=34004 RepID=UPI000782FE9D|nr:hypothetical protein [Paracoccus aminovorans]MDQ7774794.1 hypothetical protein [Paracoccus aminovorans]
MSQPVIDLRCRPAFLHDFFGRRPGTADYDTMRRLSRRLGSSGPDHFACSARGQGFLDEIRGAGPARIVVAGRPTPAQHLPNGDIAGRRLGLRDGILARFSRHRGQAAGAGGGMVETTPMTALHPDARWQRTQP